MKYKNIIKKTIITLIIVSFTGLGCGKDFLEIDSEGRINKQEVQTNPNAAEALVTGVYNSLYFGSFDPTTVGMLYMIATDIASDDGDKGSFDADFGPAREIDNFTHTPGNFVFNNLWQGYYKGISRANSALEALEGATFDAAVKNRLIGEVRFIRGMYYFNLVRLFGGVPKIIVVPKATEVNNAEFQTRATREEIYEVIKSDLQFGIDNLPQKGEAGSVVGRSTKGAAQGLLAKVHLYQKNWQMAFDLSNAIITSGKYTLHPDYTTLWRETGNNNSESIFEVQTGLTGDCNAVSPLYSNSQGPRAGGKRGWDDLGFGLNNPTANLVSAYEPGDKRRDATIIFVQPTLPGGPNPGTMLYGNFRLPTQDSVENQRYNYKAYHPAITTCGGNKDLKPKNIRILRYAEVLLINAEAAAMLNNAQGAARLNLVRARAGLAPSATATQADVWKERRVELAMEQDRFLDLVRQGRAGTVLRAHGKAFVDGKHEVYPIPQAQIDLSGGLLKQNNGY